MDRKDTVDLNRTGGELGSLKVSKEGCDLFDH